jgi:hypothetical protein
MHRLLFFLRTICMLPYDHASQAFTVMMLGI